VARFWNPTGGGGPDRIEADVPRGRRPAGPSRGEPGGELVRVDVRRGVAAELDHDPAEDLAIGAAGTGLLGAAQGGEIGVSSLAEGNATGGRGEAADCSYGRTLSELMARYP
jgi:hypothetical protein